MTNTNSYADLNNTPVAIFFYCDNKGRQTHDPVTIFEGLAKQLAVQSEPHLHELERFYTAHVGKDGLEKSTNSDELCELIKSLVMHLDESIIVIVGWIGPYFLILLSIDSVRTSFHVAPPYLHSLIIT